MALVIVLASLVFLVTLALAFLVSVSTELNSSKVYSQGANAKLLAQTAVNLATAQISDASRGLDANGNTLAWASQPGMIRTYNSAGQPAGYFRLYSWTEMTGSGAFDQSTNGVPTNWSGQKAIFTDLNQPFRMITNGITNTIYPIIDGNNLTTMAAVGGNKTYGSNNLPDIDGFYVATNAPVAATAGANPVPMPVKWLYVLENGKVVAPSSDVTGTKATVTGADSSPIVGRIAFWADDESCKVNINTASEGSYMDYPRFNSTFDTTTLSKNQPGQNEFQRYPGHPAMTSLSTVIKKPASGYTDQEWAEALYQILPRVVGGGSKGGSAPTAQANLLPSSLSPDSDRLYASVDELAFNPELSGTNREQNLPQVLNKTTVERANFFLTATSRAPDLNLFNKPRVGMWPIHVTDDATHRTAYDQLIAFCSTINQKRYYFTREDSGSATNDLPAASVTGLGRNRMLLNYLRDLTGKEIPGFSGNFLTKYPSPGAGAASDRDQILTEIFDYIRTTNLLDAKKKDDPAFVQFAPVSPTVTPPSNSGSGEVVPIVDTDTNTRGFGRFPTVSKAFLQFIGTADSTVSPAPVPPVAAGSTRVLAGFFMEMFDPSQGMVPGYPRLKIRVSGLQNFTWGVNDASRTSMQFPANDTLGTPVSFAFGQENFVGGLIGTNILGYSKGWNNASKYPFLAGAYIDLPSGPGSTFSFGGGNITIEVLSADTGDVLQTIKLNFPSTTSSTQFPVPTLAPLSVPNSNGQNFRVFAGSSGGRLNSNSTDATYAGAGWIIAQDVVRSVQCIHGDARLIAGRPSIETTDNLFAPHPNYTNPAKPMAHSLRSSIGFAYYGATGGKLANVGYLGYLAEYLNNGRSPTYANNNNYVKDFGIPSTTGVAVGKAAPFTGADIPGDWDNGFGNEPDGPYINKVDEGDIGSASQLPYYGDLRYTRIANSLFSPNRQVPSAAIFGSLPSGVMANKPWQTLLFRPGPAGHPGLNSPKDHLLLDLFHMPVVEPYAISEPLSTAGRINMNYQIVPFAYINRDTGIRSVLKSEKVIAVPDTSVNAGGGGYKHYSGSYTSTNLRPDLDLNETLKGFQQRFSGNDIFRSASEICDIQLVPSGSTYAGMGTYWTTRKATGDNSRERPYATIYPRLTTKSNTFTIHYRAQSLKKVTGGTASVWDEAKDKVTGEYRGSQTIERFIDPNDAAIPDYANPLDPDVNKPISDFYKTRILQAKQFAP